MTVILNLLLPRSHLKWTGNIFPASANSLFCQVHVAIAFELTNFR